MSATDAILDATSQCVLDFGARHTTVAEVSRRAGVSRATLYRRYPDLNAILRDLMTREIQTLIEEIDATVEGPDGRTRLVERLAAAIGALREHPLLRKVRQAEPELLLPYLLGRPGETQRFALTMITRDVGDGQRDGSVRPGDPAVIARSLLLVTQAFVFAEHGEAAADDDREMRRVLGAILTPLETA
jgi:AcrR family transcriptional regulator